MPCIALIWRISLTLFLPPHFVGLHSKQLAEASARADASAQQLERELESSRAAALAFDAERAAHATALGAALQSATDASERARVADAAHAAEIAALKVAAEESQVRIAELTDAVDEAAHVTAQRDELRQQILQIRQESYEKEQRCKLDAQRATQQATESRAAQTAAEERCTKAEFVLEQASARRAVLEQSLQTLTAQSAADAAQMRAALDAARAECDQIRAQVTDGAARRLEVSTALTQLVNSTEAMENSFTCLHCLKLLTAPTMCIPCGHTACADCILPAAASGQSAGKRPLCHECGASVRVDATVKNHLLDSLSGKFIYNRQVLAQLRSIVLP